MAEEQVADPEQQSLLTDPEAQQEAPAEPSKETEGEKPPETEQKSESEQEGKDGGKEEKGDGEGETGDDALFDPEKLELPDGFELSDERLESLKGLAEKGLTHEDVQSLVNQHTETVQQTAEAVREQVKQESAERSQEWLQTVQKDPELSKPENQKQAAAFLDKFGATDDLKQALIETGMGNHPDLVKLFYNASALIQEDNPDTGGKPAGRERSFAERMYPNQT